MIFIFLLILIKKINFLPGQSWNPVRFCTDSLTDLDKKRGKIPELPLPVRPCSGTILLFRLVDPRSMPVSVTTSPTFPVLDPLPAIPQPHFVFYSELHAPSTCTISINCPPQVTHVYRQ